MTERLIDAVCPHCGRVGTTVRVVLREDGHTKLSRRCTDCGGECIHTFDHDWLAAANNKKLRAENEKLRAEVERLRAALRWYADPRNHFPVEIRRPGDPDPAVVFLEEPPIMSDGGKRASKAMEGKP